MTDPRTDFFASGSQGAPDDSPAPADARTAFFADDKALPMSGKSASDEKSSPRYIGGDSDALNEGGMGMLEAAAHGFSGLAGHLGGGLTYLGTLAASGDPEAAEAVRQDTEKALTYEPRTEAGKEFVNAAGKITAPIGRAIEKGIGYVSDKAADKYGPLAGALETAALHAPLEVMKAAPVEAALKSVASAAPKVGEAFNRIGLEKPRAADTPGSPESISAAKATPDISQASAPLKRAIQEASDKGAVNETARDNHLEADKHGVQLMEGQATRDAVQFSNEQNSTHGAIRKRINDQETQLVDALDNIRHEAGPGSVQNNPIENGQIGVDALKAYDEPVKAAIDAKYAAARKASATGDLQMNGATFVKDAMDLLKPQNKYRFLPPTAKGILNDVHEAGGYMTLDDFQAYSTQLGNEIAKARAAGDGNAAFAIGKVNEALQKVQPAGAETAAAKALFDEARAAAKARFDAIDADPAYEAAINDVSMNGVKRGKPSDLADKFMDKYVLSAPRAQLERTMSKLSPEAREAVASHTLSTIRQSAVGSTGKISPSNYNRAVSKYDPKLDLLINPETQESLESLGRVIHNAKVEPPGGFVNYSKSGVISNAAHGVAGELGQAALDAKTFGMGSKIIRGFTENSFAKRSLAPGAGLTKPAPEPPPIGRASGGRVDHEALLNRLLQRYKAAKKMNDAGTEPLLKAPDASIIRALDIAGRSQSL